MIAGVANAQQTVRVIILPFEVYAQEDLSYLKQQIPQVIKTQLEQEGARVLILDNQTIASRQLRTDSVSAMRQIGVETGAQYVVWGSLTWLGQNFSLDSKLLSSDKVEDPHVFSAEGEGVENLPATVKTLVQAMALKLFKRETIAEVQIIR